MKVNRNYREINADAAAADPDSIYHYYRNLIALRKKHPVAVYGEYKLLLPLDTEIYAYTRTLDGEKLLVVLNFFDGTPEFTWPEEPGEGKDAELLISNYEPASGEDNGVLKLRPYEARVYRIG